MTLEKNQVLNREHLQNHMSQWTLRTRAVDRIFGTRLRLEEQQRVPYDKTVSRDLILRLIDLIKEI